MDNRHQFNLKHALKGLLIITIIMAAVFFVVFFNRIAELFIFREDPRTAYNSSKSSNTHADSSSPSTSASAPPTLAPSKTSDPTQTPTPSPTPSPTPTPTPMPIPPVEEGCLPEKFAGFEHEVISDGKILADYERTDKINFSPPPLYSAIPGVTTFRGNNYRDSASFGTVNITEGKLEKVWSIKTGYIDIWTGVGWTGQPAIVQWDKSIREMMNIYPGKKNKDGLVEVISATLDGMIYFNDLEDGKPTRDPIDVLYPHKGGVSVDPRGYPLLYAGQGIEEKEGKKVSCGMRIFSLIDGNELLFIDGYDKYTFRWWPAFDAAPLIDSVTDTLIQCGENGIVYSIKLNTTFLPDKGTINIDPEIVRYRYRLPYGYKIGMEGSPVGFRNFIYFVDNSGLLQCVDINKMEPVWLRYLNDDTDSTLALEEVAENVAYLYTACEVDLQGPGGLCYIRKINAFSGKLEWEVSIECFHDTNTNGGALASPVLGKNEISDLVIFNIAKPDGKKNNGSRLIALDKDSGDTVWSVDYDFYSWSSPVAVYDEYGRAYLLFCDSAGYMRLIEGKTGKELDAIWLEANIEASPAVFDNMAVVGTRGQKIWGIRIK